MISDRFGHAQKQGAAVIQGKMEHLNDPLLRVEREINHHIAARDQVKFREGRICQKVLIGENNSVTQFGHYAITVVLFGKEPT
ncbi:MAG: hypothetical protein WAO67_07920, partial [Yoonia sp.]